MSGEVSGLLGRVAQLLETAGIPFIELERSKLDHEWKAAKSTPT